MTILQGVDRPGYISIDEMMTKLAVQTVDLDVPELGGKVKIKPLTLEDRDKMLSASNSGGRVDNAMFAAMTVVLGMVSPSVSHDKIPALKAGNPKAVETICKAIWKLSGIELNPDTLKNV